MSELTALQTEVAELRKALTAGNFNQSPDTLRQGGALQAEDCAAAMVNVCFTSKHIKLQNLLKVTPTKSLYVQWNRRISYGTFGGRAVLEGQVGAEDTGDYVRVGVPMAYYAELRRTTYQSNLMATQNGEKPEDLEAESAAMTIASAVEFDCFLGKANFSNAGVFDGNPSVIPALPGMFGLDVQIRQSDMQANAKDLMFESHGSNFSMVVTGGGVLTQTMIEDSAVRSLMNHGEALLLLVDPLVASAYNKAGYASKERIVISGTAQHASGADFTTQFTSAGTVKIDTSRFLSGKTRPYAAKISAGAPLPLSTTPTVADAAGSTTFVSGEKYIYLVTAVNEVGESTAATAAQFTVTGNANQIQVTITAGTNHRYFNVYRTANNGAAATAKFIGSLANTVASGSTLIFYDLNNKKPGFVTGFLIQDNTMDLCELKPYSRMKLAISDLSETEAHFRFITLRVKEPRKNVIIENLVGDQSF